MGKIKVYSNSGREIAKKKIRHLRDNLDQLNPTTEPPTEQQQLFPVLQLFHRKTPANSAHSTLPPQPIQAASALRISRKPLQARSARFYREGGRRLLVHHSAAGPRYIYIHTHTHIYLYIYIYPHEKEGEEEGQRSIPSADPKCPSNNSRSRRRDQPESHLRGSRLHERGRSKWKRRASTRSLVHGGGWGGREGLVANSKRLGSMRDTVTQTEIRHGERERVRERER